jgi:hypothetical protein
MAIKTNILKKFIGELLETKCSNVYYEIADNTSNFPYLTFFIDVFSIGDREDKQLEINIYGKDVEVAENIADGICNIFKNYKYVDENMLIFTNVNARNSIELDDKTIKRRRLLIDLYFYDRSVS